MLKFVLSLLCGCCSGQREEPEIDEEAGCSHWVDLKIPITSEKSMRELVQESTTKIPIVGYKILKCCLCSHRFKTEKGIRNHLTTEHKVGVVKPERTKPLRYKRPKLGEFDEYQCYVAQMQSYLEYQSKYGDD